MRPAHLITMYDSVNPGAIPANAAIVAGYVAPSRYAWAPEAWGLFPGAIHVTITPQVTGSGMVLDVEPGDAAASQVPGWLARERAAGFVPWVYTSFSNWAAVQAAVNQANMAHPPYWIADYSQDNQTWWPELNSISAAAWQFTDNPPGNPYDTSFVDSEVFAMTMAWNDTFPTPMLDANGNYVGDGPSPTSVEDYVRFTNVSVRWLVEVAVPELVKEIAALKVQLGTFSASGSITLTPEVPGGNA